MKIKRSFSSSYINHSLTAKPEAYPPTVDPFFDNVVLLLQANGDNGANNDVFLDSSPSNHTITKVGNISQGPSSLYYEDGWTMHTTTAGYLTCPGSAALAFGTGDFTVECWIYLKALPASDGFHIWNNRTSASSVAGTFYFHVNPTRIAVGEMVTGNVPVTYSNTLPLDTWVHLAATRSSGQSSIFLNGVKVATGSNTSNYTNTANTYATMSNWEKNGNGFNGYISSIRVVKGVAVYDNDFTPPKSKYFVNTAETVFLLGGQPNYKDQSQYNNIVSTSGIVRWVRPNSVLKNYERYSPTKHTGGISTWESLDSYLSIADSEDFEFADGDFTIEMWYYSELASPSAAGLITKRTTLTSGTAPYLIYHNGTTLSFYSSSDGTNWNIANARAFTTSLQSGAWHHIAVTRSGTTFRGFLNGEQRFTFESTAILHNNTAPLLVGVWDNSPRGKISDIRMVKGSAVYTENFNPPTSRLEAISGTVLLLRGENYSIADMDRNIGFGTYLNSGYINTSEKVNNQGSFEFIGAAGGLQVDLPHNELALGALDFTVEFWVKPTSVPTDFSAILSTRFPSNSNSANAFWIGFNPNTLLLQFNSGGALVTSVDQLTLNQWHHVCIIRASGRLCMYIDGIAKSETFSSIDYTGMELVVGNSRGYIYNLSAYIDDLRITTKARYISNFTPPQRSLASQRGY